MLLSLHIFCAFLSLALLLIRGAMQLSGKNWRAVKLLKILPHLTDTLLILSGLSIFLMLGYSLKSWLIMKILCLALYVFFSVKFFSRKATKPQPIFFILALLSFLGAMVFAYLPHF